jgi:hypothetical protein
MVTAATPALTDQDVVKLLFSEKKGTQWEATYNGAHAPHYPSASEAVAALLLKMAFYTQKTPAQMDRLIRGSELASSKFDERRGGSAWLARRIQQAIEIRDAGLHQDRLHTLVRRAMWCSSYSDAHKG